MSQPNEQSPYAVTQQFADLPVQPVGNRPAPWIPPPPSPTTISSDALELLPDEPTSWTALPLFAGLNESAIGQFRAAMQVVLFAPGQTLLHQGEDGDHLFVLERGTLRITVRNDKQVTVFECTVAAPAIVGEMALVTHEPRTATVTAEEEAHCLRIDQGTVADLFARHPNTAVFLTRLVGERLLENRGIRKVGKYEVLGRLGSGGVATVFEARHPTLGTPVALKMLSHALVYDAAFAEHFRKEALLVAQLNHDHIVRVLDTEQAYGTHFIVMEKLTGDLLESVIDHGQPMDWPSVRRILREVCDALAYSHGQGLIHRDIKPANVFLLTDGKAKILDFGIATQPSGPIEGTKVLGTPYYMSPEQIMGAALDGRTDLYSLGILAYELCCRQLPFDADTLPELFGKHLTHTTPDPRDTVPDLPDDLREFILRATEKRADDRFASCAEASAFLKAAAEVPVLGRFAMSSLAVTYHSSKKALVERVLAEAQRLLEHEAGVALFVAHRDSQAE